MGGCESFSSDELLPPVSPGPNDPPPPKLSCPPCQRLAIVNFDNFVFDCPLFLGFCDFSMIVL